MTIEVELQRIAVELNGGTQRELQVATSRKAELERELLELESRIELLNTRGERLPSYLTELSHDVICPYCWIKDNVKAQVKPIPGTAEEDWFRCKRCGKEFVVPA